jgi:hypothetical protein
MKKHDLSEAASNMLIFSSVTVALMPFLLGDHLLVLVSGLMHESGLLISQFSDYVSWLVS